MSLSLIAVSPKSSLSVVAPVLKFLVTLTLESRVFWVFVNAYSEE
jgi:hypothetical protein